MDETGTAGHRVLAGSIPGGIVAPAGPARIEPPIPRAGSVVRTRLLCRLDRAPGGSVVTIVGPAGSGKSTLLGQWSERRPRLAYLRLDRSDADAARLVAGLAAALARHHTLPQELLDQLDRPSDTLEAALLPRLVEALWAASEPVVLALDDLEQVRGSASLDALAWIVGHLPERARLVLASRSRPPLPLERLRVEGRLVSIGPEDLALAPDEVGLLAEAVGRPLSQAHAALIAQRTRGWTAAVRLALDLPDPSEVRGDAGAIAAYLREQVLGRLDADGRARLRRVAVLDPMTGPLVDAVLETSGSLGWLRTLADDTLFITQLDARRTTYRLHPLLRDVLLDDLASEEPGAAAVLHARAAIAADSQGDVEAAAAHATASGDLEVLETIVCRHAVPLFWRGRLATVARWLDPFDRDGVRERHAAVALLAAWFHAHEGRTAAAERWLTIAQHSDDRRPMPDGSPSKDVWIAALRALMMPDDLAASRLDARASEAGLPRASYFRQHAGLANALVEVCDGDLASAVRHALDAAAAAEAVRAVPGQLAALGIAAAAAMELGEVDQAATLVHRGLDAMRRAGLEHYSISAVLIATAARRRSSLGDHAGARELLARFDRLRPFLGTAFPAFTVLAQLQAMRARLQGDELAASRILLDEARAVIGERRGLGWLSAAVEQVQETVDRARHQRDDRYGLTAAELRVLSLLPTHLSIREMAERMRVSPHTVKTQVVALYGKLAATSRLEAIEIGIASGLLDASVLYRPAALDPPDEKARKTDRPVTRTAPRRGRSPGRPRWPEPLP